MLNINPIVLIINGVLLLPDAVNILVKIGLIKVNTVPKITIIKYSWAILITSLSPKLKKLTRDVLNTKIINVYIIARAILINILFAMYLSLSLLSLLPMAWDTPTSTPTFDM